MKPNALIPQKPENITIDDVQGLGRTVTVDAADLINTAIYLSSVGYDWLMFATGIDAGDSIELLYRISASAGDNSSIFLRTKVTKDDAVVDSLVPIWPAANWHEREIFDLLGVKFHGHPNMRRIFLPDDWEGYPLRKDYDNPNMRRRPQYF